MKSILRKAMWPAAIAAAMLGVMSVLGGGTGVKTANAATGLGDVCGVKVDSRVTAGTDGQGNPIYNVAKNGVAYGLTFRIADLTPTAIVTGKDDSGATVTERFAITSGPNTQVAIDSETGSARLTSKAEIVNTDTVPATFPDGTTATVTAPDVAHTLISPTAGVGTQTVDTMSPRFFNDADGNPENSINQWLADNGYPQFSSDDANACGQGTLTIDPTACGSLITAGNVSLQQIVGAPTSCKVYFDDPWGFVDFTCIEAGQFHIDILTPGTGLTTETVGQTLKFNCPGQADTATISVLYPTLETNPATGGVAVNHGETPVTVTVLDQNGNRIDGVKVTLTTDNCTFQPSSPTDVFSPAGGGKTVDVVSDTDAAGPDQNFLTNNPLQTQAGTAEATLDCDGPLNTFGPGGTGHVSAAAGTPGTAHITAVVDRAGADIVLSSTVNVVGPTSANGLTLTLSATSVQCGNPITATVKAVDANGVAVSDGTPIFFTTDTSSGVVGGTEGAQGSVPTVGGAASANIATDPSKPGTHTVIAFVMNGAGGVAVQQTATYSCTVPAPAAPVAPVSPPGTGSITPPNTGDAGLAATSSGTSSLFVIAGAFALALAGFATFKFSRDR